MSFMIINFLTYSVNPDCRTYLCRVNSKMPELTACKSANNLSELIYRGSNLTHSNHVAMQPIVLKVFSIGKSQMGIDYPKLEAINLWIHAIVYRTLPCLIMLVLSVLLIYVMNIANTNKKKLQKQERRMASDFNRTTSMLLVIVILFLIMEFPHGKFKNM